MHATTIVDLDTDIPSPCSQPISHTLSADLELPQGSRAQMGYSCEKRLSADMRSCRIDQRRISPTQVGRVG